MKMRYILILCCIISVFGCRKNLNIYANDPGDPDCFYNWPAGASALEILNDTRFNSMKNEIQYMSGFKPSGSSVAHLQNFLSTLLKKPSGITIVTREIPISASNTLSIDQIGVYLLITNGIYTESHVLGAAYRNT